MKKNIIPDINLQNEIQKNKILNSRDFYKGKSFRFAHEWHDGITYFNDDFYTDFVVYKNVLLACKNTHTSNSLNVPVIIYDGIQPIGIENSEFWSFVLSGIVNPDASFKVQFSPSVNALPKASEHVGEIFVVGPIGNYGNAYEEYIAIHTPSYDEEYTWELVGGENVSIDLSNYVTKAELQNQLQQTSEVIKTWVTTQDYTTTSEVNKMIEAASLSGDIDLSDYYTKDEIDSKGFITSIPSEYITESELSNVTEQLKSYIDEKNNYQDSKIASKQDTLINGQNIKTINGQNILGEGNIEIVGGETDLTNYVTKDELVESTADWESSEGNSFIKNRTHYISELSKTDIINLGDFSEGDRIVFLSDTATHIGIRDYTWNNGVIRYIPLDTNYISLTTAGPSFKVEVVKRSSQEILADDLGEPIFPGPLEPPRLIGLYASNEWASGASWLVSISVLHVKQLDGVFISYLDGGETEFK